MNLNATLLVQMFTFGVFIWFTMKFIWPPFIRILRDRQTRIEDGLAAAKKSQEVLAGAQKEAEDIILSAREKATNILRKTEDQAQKLLKEAEEKAQTQASAILIRGREELEVEVHRVREQLMKDVAQLSIRTAGLILRKEVDESTHRGLIIRALEGDNDHGSS